MIAALDCLSGSDRELIEVHVIDEESLRDIAKERGLSKDAMRKRYNIAASKLKELTK